MPRVRQQWQPRQRSAEHFEPEPMAEHGREYLMIRPEFFEVVYAINPWMNPSVPASSELAVRQWIRLRSIVEDIGHTVHCADPVPGLPDLVYTANAGFVVNGKALVARFAHAERAPEEDLHAAWFQRLGLDVQRATQVNEGEGDFQFAGSRLVAAYGQRTSRAAVDEVAAWSGLPVVGLELVDPRFYHLDTALAVLAPADDAADIAYYPPAFSPGSRSALRELYPDAIIATAAEAGVLGLNVLADGRHVVMTDAAPTLAAQFRERGYDVIGVEFSELLKGGGSVKCCMLELRR